MHIWGRVVLGGIAVLTSSLVLSIPAGAAQSHPGGVTDTCPEVLAGAPTGGIEKVTRPTDGSEVRGGDVVSVTLRWDTTTFTGPVLHKALDCVTIDGAPADELSTQERDTPNDGIFEFEFTVPGDLPDGTRLCDRGFVSGPAGEGFDRQKSNGVCFVVRVDQPAAPPVPAGAPTPAETSTGPDSSNTPSAADTQLTRPDGPAPSAAGPEASSIPFAFPGPTSSPVAGTAPTPAAITVVPAGKGRPGTEVLPETAAADQQPTLPRTGSAVQDAMLLGGLALILGGLCLVVGRRPVRAASA